MSIKTKLIIWPTLMAVAAVFAVYKTTTGSQNPYVVKMSVVSGAPKYEFAVIYQVNGQKKPPEKAKGDWTRTIPANRGDVVVVVSEQQMSALLTCTIKINGDPASSAVIDWPGRVACNATVT